MISLIYIVSLYILYSSQVTNIYELWIWPTPNVSLWLHSAVGRALHRYHGGLGFKSHLKPKFFSGFLWNWLKLQYNALITCVHLSLMSAAQKMYTCMTLHSYITSHFNNIQPSPLSLTPERGGDGWNSSYKIRKQHSPNNLICKGQMRTRVLTR